MAINLNSNIFNVLNSSRDISTLYKNTGLAKAVTSQSNTTGTNPLRFASKLTSKTDFDYGQMADLQQIKTGSQDLKSAIDSLGQSITFNQRGPVSSDVGALSVKTTGKVSASKIPDVEVQIEKLAKGQENTGVSLQQSTSFGTSGSQEFEIAVGGKSHKITVDISAKDTNVTVQQKMADAINKAGIGVAASVGADKASSTSTLSIKADKTGDVAKARFEIKDTRGSLVEKTGIAAVSQQAQDAEYSVNGAKRASHTNDVELGNGLRGTLKKETETTVTVTQRTDTGYATDKVADLVNTYNSLVTRASENPQDKGSNKLYNSLVGVAKTYMPSLSAVGINLQDDGTLSIDQDKLGQSVSSGALERFFVGGGSNYGFSSRLGQVAGGISRNPAAYGGKAATLNVSESESSSGFYSNLQQTRYNQFSNMGLFLDLFL